MKQTKKIKKTITIEMVNGSELIIEKDIGNTPFGVIYITLAQTGDFVCAEDVGRLTNFLNGNTTNETTNRRSEEQMKIILIDGSVKPKFAKRDLVVTNCDNVGRVLSVGLRNYRDQIGLSYYYEVVLVDSDEVLSICEKWLRSYKGEPTHCSCKHHKCHCHCCYCCCCCTCKQRK